MAEPKPLQPIEKEEERKDFAPEKTKSSNLEDDKGTILTPTEKTDLTDGGDTTLHKHDIYSVATQVDTFTSSGTYTKPTGAVKVFVQIWGGGGSGAHNNNTSHGAGGAGGGGYAEAWFDAADVGATETVTIGAGGAGVSGDNNGNSGGNSTFGSLLTGNGGSGGTQSGGNGLGGTGGGPIGNLDYPVIGVANPTDGQPGKSGLYSGGGGTFLDTPNTGGSGGAAYYGGGGGGAWGTASKGSGGSSVLGGAGGGANAASVNGTDGAQPGGGGGAAVDAISGKGGDGQCIVTTFF